MMDVRTHYVADPLNAFNLALARAGHGISWSYPCLLWFADYVIDATGFDPASEWRSVEWDEATGRRIMDEIGDGMMGSTPVEKALAATAERHGWAQTDAPQQGSIMVGAYSFHGTGVAAIFDGDKRWAIGHEDGLRITPLSPERMWVIK